MGLAESLFRATLSIFGHGVKLCAMRRQLSAALRIISCLRALGPSCSAPLHCVHDLAESRKWSRSKENGLIAQPYFLNKLVRHDTRMNNGPLDGGT